MGIGQKAEFVPSVPPEVIEVIGKIEKPTVRQQLIIDELTQTTNPELGPILAQELAETMKEQKA